MAESEGYRLALYLAENLFDLTEGDNPIHFRRSISPHPKILLVHFYTNPEEYITAEQIQEHLGMRSIETAKQTISRLRRALYPFDPLETIIFHGYRLTQENANRITLYESLYELRRVSGK